MPYSLDHRLAFPHPSLADDDGLLAIGGDLQPERLLLAYSEGIFPWYDDDCPILWHAPSERFVLVPKELKISKSMQQLMRKDTFTVQHDQAFKEVIHQCAAMERKGQEGTWITREMEQAYIKLHELGYAHSIETYSENGQLVGGLYGVQIGSIFCGESMFSKVSNASKLALIYLCERFNFELIDCQVYTEHLASLGAKLIPASIYYGFLRKQKLQAHAL